MCVRKEPFDSNLMKKILDQVTTFNFRTGMLNTSCSCSGTVWLPMSGYFLRPPLPLYFGSVHVPYTYVLHFMQSSWPAFAKLRRWQAASQLVPVNPALHPTSHCWTMRASCCNLCFHWMENVLDSLLPLAAQVGGGQEFGNGRHSKRGVYTVGLCLPFKRSVPKLSTKKIKTSFIILKYRGFCVFF